MDYNYTHNHNTDSPAVQPHIRSTAPFAALRDAVGSPARHEWILVSTGSHLLEHNSRTLHG